MACGLSLQAQTNIFHESFDAEQSKQPTDVAWYEYINTVDGDTRNIWTIEPYAGEGCMNFFNAEVEANWWQRAIKFRNLPLQEGKSYRLTYYFRGQNEWNIDGETKNKSKMSVALMQGGEDADIPLLDANGNEFKYEVSYFNPEKYEKYTKMFYFASAQLQKDTYAEKNPDKDPLADKWFATFNIYNPGDYYLDEVDLSESPIAGVYFNSDVIRVDFGYATNVTDLVKANPLGRVIMPIDCASVTINGNAAEIVAVELQKDGYMYIFLGDEISAGPEDKIEIGFKNPEDETCQVKYKGTLAPEGAVPSFGEEAGEYLEEGLDEITSWVYTEPIMVSTIPVDGSFALDESMTEISFTFDKPVMGHDDNHNPLVAKLNSTEDLILATQLDGDEGTTTLTFVRKDRQNFPKGAYSVTLEGVTSDQNIKSFETFTLDFETGKIQLAEKTYELAASALFPDAADGSIPEGWTVYSDGEERAGGTSYGSGGRVFSTVAPQGKGIYTRAANGGDGSAQGPAITVPAGDIELRSYLAFWSSSSNIQVDVYNEAGEIVANKVFTPSVAGEASRNNAGFQFEVCPITFSTQGGNYYVKYTLLTTGFNGMYIGGYEAYKYTITEGESTEAEVAFADNTFGGPNGINAANNGAPKAGSGWRMYDKDDREAYFNNGEEWGYGHSRIWTGRVFKNLGTLFYTRNSFPKHYITYGEVIEEEPDEPKLTLATGRYQVTYYALNWKVTPQTYTFQIIDEETKQVVKEEITEVAETANGVNEYSGDSHKIQFLFNVTKAGNYSIKFGGTGESFTGNVKIEKLGSQAAYNIGLVNAARALAIEELEASADEKYNGATKTALQAAVDKYADLSDIHTPAEATAAKAELESLTKDMATRREYVDRYSAALDAAAAIIAEVGEKEATDEDPGHPATKYAKLEAFTNLEAVYNANSAKTAQEQEDAALIAATNELENNTTWLKNMKDNCVTLLTQQIVDAATALVSLDANTSNDEYVIAAGNALTDDQEIAKALQLRVTKAIYDKLANGENPFVVYDSETQSEDVDSIDLSSFIQNRDLYTTETDINKNLTSIDNLPGWSLNTLSGTPGVEFGWVAYNANKYNPVINQFIICGWNTEFDLYQTIKNLPVGKYTYVAGTQDRGFGDVSDNKKAYIAENQSWHVTGTDGTNEIEGDIISYIWWQVGETKDIAGFNIEKQGQWYGLTECVSKQFAVPAVGEGMTGEMTIGAHPKEFEGIASVDNFRIYMVGKDDTFNYAAAAQAIAEEIATAVEEVSAPEGEPVNVSYYDLTGKQVSTPSGITIKVDTYKNGYMKVSKILVK